MAKAIIPPPLEQAVMHFALDQGSLRGLEDDLAEWGRQGWVIEQVTTVPVRKGGGFLRQRDAIFMCDHVLILRRTERQYRYRCFLIERGMTIETDVEQIAALVAEQNAKDFALVALLHEASISDRSPGVAAHLLIFARRGNAILMEVSDVQ